ncbi:MULTISPECIES: hypothetical protein [Brenneria]|uniref:Uncharacterized protein n=1 Tax=Brenneria nigrifluens DSM 30175 = ATCC 13028 TaxID=1121120 RepID=A0A2U1UVP4_9GAMM|nr:MULTISPECIES: hypothetical protein [Brenneria]PWC25745.1 hypothetical protein DDT54_03500 [Brenneria nigrifluens DSM 30175 = ATCC 13028]QCR03389.1 hypothetical protein EH206_03680 [Brenneria nigrifluens DSM 30175 = ATCC 13028]
MVKNQNPADYAGFFYGGLFCPPLPAFFSRLRGMWRRFGYLPPSVLQFRLKEKQRLIFGTTMIYISRRAPFWLLAACLIGG